MASGTIALDWAEHDVPIPVAECSFVRDPVTPSQSQLQPLVLPQFSHL
jgi:hypothetical protein